MNYNHISNTDKNFFEGKKVIVRVGVNVPITDGKIEDSFRLRSILPTIEFLSEAGAKVVLLGHIGREKEQTLEEVFAWLKKRLKRKNKEISFHRKTFIDFDSEKFARKVERIKKGSILLLDNVRATEDEKNNSVLLAQKIAKNVDIYINEAFSVSHRNHMSVDALPAQFFLENRLYGFHFEKEVSIVEKVKNPSGKSVCILGGAKIATKVPMIEKLINKFDMIIIGGAVANNFYKQLGHEIGQSKYDSDFHINTKVLKKWMDSGKIFLPNIVITESGEKEISEIQKTDRIVDISPNAFFEIEEQLRETEFVFFNGPVGYYEGGYIKGTRYLLKVLSNKQNYFIAGGGNTASVITELGLEKNMDFISTGGGALIKAISE